MGPSITNGSGDLQSAHCKLLGNLWGRFELQFDRPVGKNLYLGRQDASQETVWIKEYRLKDSGDERRRAFQQLIDLNLKLGQGPDFRLVQLKDFATTPQACYLISRPLPGAEPLSQYLATHGPLSPHQVRQVLQQCLETLRYLHTACGVLWPTGAERGLCHGNLSLDSVWIRPPSCQAEDCLVYVTDLALWEHIFWPRPLARSGRDLGTLHQDLNKVGEIGMALLGAAMGGVNSPQPPLEHPSPQLMGFLQDLTGQSTAGFRTTEEAIQALRRLPELSRQPWPAAPMDEGASPAEKSPRPKSWAAYIKRVQAVAGAALGGLGLVWMGHGLMQQWRMPPQAAQGITARYLLEPQGTWQATGLPEGDGLMAAVAATGHSLQPAEPLAGRPDQITRSDIFEQLLAGQADVALMDNGGDIPAGLQVHPVAYDAVVPFVAFSQENQARRATTLIGHSLSLTQLRQVLTGDLETLNGAEVQAYFPEVPYIKARGSQGEDTPPPKVTFSVQPPLFDRLYRQVLGEDAEALTAMEQVLEERRGELRSHIQNHNGHGSYDIFTNINRTFSQWNVLDNASEPTVAIGFDRLSNVQQRCDVYPLAINAEGRQLQLLQQGDQQQQQPITPRTDLCRDLIQPNPALLQQLATEGLLAYELVVVYPDASETGAAVAQLLSHPDHQTHLTAAGLTPIDYLNHQVSSPNP